MRSMSSRLLYSFSTIKIFAPGRVLRERQMESPGDGAAGTPWAGLSNGPDVGGRGGRIIAGDGGVKTGTRRGVGRLGLVSAGSGTPFCPRSWARGGAAAEVTVGSSRSSGPTGRGDSARGGRVVAG